MKILGIVPARGGSKGVPRKNIRPLSGKPLLQYTAEAALASQHLSRVILTTEDVEIAEAGRRCGLDIPFLRPPELALDDTPTLPVVQHAVRRLEEKGEIYDAICLLQPTHPFRRTEDIDGCIQMLNDTQADAVVTVLPVPAEHNPHWVLLVKPDGSLYWSTGEDSPIPRRQQLPPAFHREGSVYVTRRSVLMEQNSLFGKRLCGFPMRPEHSVNIDSLADWERAEAYLASLSKIAV